MVGPYYDDGYESLLCVPNNPNPDRTTVEIRYLTASDDRAAISRIYEESWKHAYRGIVPQDYLDSIPKGQWARHLDDPQRHAMVCIEDDEYVGVSSFCRSRFEQYPEWGEVVSIYLLPGYMGRGYGGELLEAVLGELRKQGFADVFLWVLERNDRARSFYKRHGFSCTGDCRDDVIGGKALRELRYVRQLG